MITYKHLTQDQSGTLNPLAGITDDAVNLGGGEASSA